MAPVQGQCSAQGRFGLVVQALGQQQSALLGQVGGVGGRLGFIRVHAPILPATARNGKGSP